MTSAIRRWLLVSVLAPPHGEEHLLVDALRRLGAHTVDREGERFVAWLPPPSDSEALVKEAVRAVRASTSLTDPGLHWRWAEPGEWEARWAGELRPRRVTDRIVVTPVGEIVDRPFERPEGEGPTGERPSDDRPDDGRPDSKRPGDIVIRLHASTAFGTAEHPTTRLSLRHLDRLVREGDRIADIGTGSGILAIAAARLGAASVLALESDPVACEAARANVRLADLTDRIRVREMTVDADRTRRLGRFQGVVVNLEWPLLQPLLPAVPQTLVAGGWLIIAGPLEPERDLVLSAARSARLTLRDEAVESGWWAAWLKR